jgi:polysaccharide pyruvyl transferase WcaK-like protein
MQGKWWRKPLRELATHNDLFSRMLCSADSHHFHSPGVPETPSSVRSQPSDCWGMRICIMGTPVRQGNRGVLALGASLINLCWQASGGGEVVLLLGNRDNQPAPFRVSGELRIIQVVNARMSLRSRLRDHFSWILLMSVLYRLMPLAAVRAAIARSTPWIKTVVEADLVGDVRGGDSFSDIYGMRRFLSSFLIVWTVVLVKGTIVQFPQTYGPYCSPLARWLARYLLRRSSTIIARDKQSQRVAQELVGPAQQVLLSPDVAFSLEAVMPERLELDPPLPSAPSSVLCPPSSAVKPIGLNVNGLMFHGGYTRDNMFELKLDYAAFLPELVIALLAEQPGELWLVPHTYAAGNVESDNEASEQLRDGLPPELRTRVRLVAGEYDQHELKWIIGQCDFFIGSRMHSCIAALSQGIPCVGVAYSQKFAGVFESVGMEKWVVEARSSNQHEAVSRIVALYRQRNGVRQALLWRADQARQQLIDLFRELVRRHDPACQTPPARRGEVQAGPPC